jgi:hypothetical protein
MHDVGCTMGGFFYNDKVQGKLILVTELCTMKEFKTLSIDNLVIYDYSVYKIKAIYDNTRVYIDLQPIEPASADIEITTTPEKVSFIPLGLSVLEDFAFKNFTDKKEDITYTHPELKKIWVVQRKEYFTCFIGPNHLTIKFLHELQNLIMKYEEKDVLNYVTDMIGLNRLIFSL